MTLFNFSDDLIVATVDLLGLFPTSLAENQAGQLPLNNNSRYPKAVNIA